MAAAPTVEDLEGAECIGIKLGAFSKDLSPPSALADVCPTGELLCAAAARVFWELSVHRGDFHLANEKGDTVLKARHCHGLLVMRKCAECRRRIKERRVRGSEKRHKAGPDAIHGPGESMLNSCGLCTAIERALL